MFAWGVKVWLAGATGCPVYRVLPNVQKSSEEFVSSCCPLWKHHPRCTVSSVLENGPAESDLSAPVARQTSPANFPERLLVLCIQRDSSDATGEDPEPITRGALRLRSA